MFASGLWAALIVLIRMSMWWYFVLAPASNALIDAIAQDSVHALSVPSLHTLGSKRSLKNASASSYSPGPLGRLRAGRSSTVLGQLSLLLISFELGWTQVERPGASGPVGWSPCSLSSFGGSGQRLQVAPLQRCVSKQSKYFHTLDTFLSSASLSSSEVSSGIEVGCTLSPAVVGSVLRWFPTVTNSFPQKGQWLEVADCSMLRCEMTKVYPSNRQTGKGNSN